jgi:hypothetical protein
MNSTDPYEKPPESPVTAPEAEGGKAPARRVCGAKKKDGTACRAPAMPNGRCRIHGGLTPSGPALPQYKTGRYSRWLSPALQEDFAAAIAEGPDALDLTPELALVEARLNERLRQLAEAEVPAWAGILEAVGELKAATREKDAGRIAAALRTLEDTAKQGAGTDAAWRDVRGFIHDRRRLVQAETARRAKLMLFVEAEKHRGAMRLLASVVSEEVNNLPGLAALLVKHEGRLDVERLKFALFKRIGTRIKEAAPLLYPRPGETIEKRGI